MKKFASLICLLMTAVAFSGMDDKVLRFSTPGPDRYADGSRVLDGECYALVWSPKGTAFAGFNADGTAVSANDRVVLAAPLAQDGKCRDAIFQVPAAEYAELAGGEWAVCLVDTRNIAGVPMGAEDGKPLRVVQLFDLSSIMALSAQAHTSLAFGDTLVLTYFSGSRIYTMNVGDSRAYLLRDGKLKQITEDHTYVNSLVKAGVITEEEAVDHENRNMITRAVGADYGVQPDFFSGNIKAGDIVMMCSDGLYDEVPEDKMVELLLQKKGMNDIASDLVDEANKNGGADNITTIVLKVTEDDLG